MKTPQQIIDALPEGNRKRACVIAQAVLGGDGADVFWLRMGKGNYQEAATGLLHEHLPPFFAVLADMIWEG